MLQTNKKLTLKEEIGSLLGSPIKNWASSLTELDKEGKITQRTLLVILIELCKRVEAIENDSTV